MTVLEFIEFSAFYKEKKLMTVAVDNVSFKVEEGEFVVLIGPSGSGKTTLLRSIIDLIDYTSGEILFEGEPLQNTKLSTRNIAYICQECNLMTHMTVFDNIAFPLRNMNTNQEEIKARVNEIADITGITPLLTRKPRSLSGGQLQKVEIARALIKNPRLMLFDEPFSNLDQANKMKMRAFLKEMHKKFGMTVVFVTHDLNDAFNLADKIVVINEGEIAQIGSPSHIRAFPNSDFVREFIRA